ncbi:NAD-dependent malic enzyme [Paenibacillus alginolyticus]|uniref:NAD(P)-dependent malic enzyme n=1 Tax=Paenibacillus alginolyticus TaxID=59839 RepID=UPI00040D3582|nr:malic enzyme-like NAD(P)-binding protein [Paenibacillus alginolyticus]MCY9665794.1 NAD-dependent malic enzyme [Paenibacillus alginolyticus]
MTDIRHKALQLHEKYKGKLIVEAKMAVKDLDDLSLVYSPGVAEPCKVIAEHREKVYDYTMKGNLIAVISDGTAVLGLGNIGPEAAIPVMEGKALLFKLFAGIDAFPLCLDTTDVDRIVETVKLLKPTFGGINLEDIAAPNCFIIEERLKKEMDIPVFHDDQHGTAVVAMAGLINAVKLVGKQLHQIKVVVNGAGAAGVAVVKLLIKFGISDIILCDSKGAIYEGRPTGMNAEKDELALQTNRSMITGPLTEAVTGADVFIGLSMPGVLTSEMVSTMNSDPIVFALANPVPEIMPEDAKRGGAKVVGTGRSDYPNQINNVLAFPGIFRGALDVQATQINEEMKIAAVYAISNLVNPDQLCAEYIIPEPLDNRVVPAVASAVAKAALDSGVARKNVIPSYQENNHSIIIHS